MKDRPLPTNCRPFPKRLPSQPPPVDDVPPLDVDPTAGPQAVPGDLGLSVVPGIRRFEGVEPEIAGGSLPNVVGLEWLADKGYRTLLDLRDPGPDQPAFIAEAARLGLRYLPLPTSARSIDSEHVRRFNDELARSDARPLYFFDADGDRAGALWYIRRLTMDHLKVDVKTASREAKDLGLVDQKFWLAATSYLDSLSNPSSPSGTADDSPTDGSGPPTDLPTTSNPSAAHDSDGLNLAETFGDPPDPTPPAAPLDPVAWKQYAALIVSSLGVPLAYFSRTIFSFGRPARASLPAPSRRPKSLPGASDA